MIRMIQHDDITWKAFKLHAFHRVVETIQNNEDIDAKIGQSQKAKYKN